MSCGQMAMTLYTKKTYLGRCLVDDKCKHDPNCKLFVAPCQNCCFSCHSSDCIQKKLTMKKIGI